MLLFFVLKYMFSYYIVKPDYYQMEAHFEKEHKTLLFFFFGIRSH